MKNGTSRVVLAVAVLGLLNVAAAPARAGLLLGDSVEAEFHYDGTPSVVEQDGTLAVSPTATFNSLSGQYPVYITSTVSDDQVQVVFDHRAIFDLSPGFDGLTFTDVSANPGLGGFNVTATGASGFDASRVSLTSDSVSLDFQGLSFGRNDTITVTLSSNSPLSTPEPSSLVSGAIAGFLGLGYAWRHRRKIPSLA